MKRLTYRLKSNAANLYDVDKAHGDKTKESVARQNAFDLLAAYEDTGLTPEEISELAQAKREGRIIPELPQDMENLLEPLKLQSALSSEMRKLEFRKANRPKDISILDYTIIAALSSVLKQAAEAEKERKDDEH
jgi:hypothetical protein